MFLWMLVKDLQQAADFKLLEGETDVHSSFLCR